jgi:DNA repair protein RadC
MAMHGSFAGSREGRAACGERPSQGRTGGTASGAGKRSAAALKQNAAAVILAHPHPSGVAEPSQADELITQRLKDALALVDIRVLNYFLG